MIEQTLTVEYVKYPTVFLKSPPKKACEGCNGKCGSQVFSKLFSTEKKLFPIELSESVVPGQKITLSLDDSDVVKHAFMVYMFPLIFAFISLFSFLPFINVIAFRSTNFFAIASPIPLEDPVTNTTLFLKLIFMY